MSRKRSVIDAELQELYNKIPKMACKGLCWTSCGPIAMSTRERQRIRQLGVEIPRLDDARASKSDYYCPALTEDKKCSVYEVRPAICRVWGATEGLKCPYGCVPEGSALKDAEAWKILRDATVVGGDEDGRYKNADMKRLENPLLQKVMRAEIARGVDVELKRHKPAVPRTFASKPTRWPRP